MFRSLVANRSLSHRVLAKVPTAIRAFAAPIVAAQRRLAALIVPVKTTAHLETASPESPARLLAYYHSAQRRFGVPWSVLASVNFIESKFGRVLGPSTSGAQGPMQFIPSTWAAYGAGGDIRDPHDSVMGAARYLAASGSPQRTRAALFAYNQSSAYVAAVMTYARAMARDIHNFYDFYFWQVFVATKQGVVQLTGPGSNPS